MEHHGLGFGPETFSFLQALASNNNKAWFEQNRTRYEAHWLEPAYQFVEQVHQHMESLSPSHLAISKINKSIRRINRDVRFSANKSPYQPRLHLVFWCGDHPNRSPAIHLVLDPDSVGYGVGQWMLSPQALSAFRKQILLDDGFAPLEQAIMSAQSVGCVPQPPELKRLPHGVPTESGRDEWLRRKSLVVRTMEESKPPEWIMGNDGIKHFCEVATTLAPINRWLMDYCQ